MATENLKTKITFSEKNRLLLEREGRFKDKTVSELINKLLDQYYTGIANASVKAAGDEVNQKLDELTNKVNTLIANSNATYRSTSYVAELATQNANKERAGIARKRAMRNYQKLRTGTLTKEQYLLNTDEEDLYEDIYAVPQNTVEDRTSKSVDEKLSSDEEQENISVGNKILNKYLGGK